MAKPISAKDLIDAQGVADIMGLSHPNSVATYQRRYSDMPKPIVDLGPRRVKLWSRRAIEGWMTSPSRSTGPAVPNDQVVAAHTDRPIRSEAEDLLERGRLAAALASAIENVDVSEGAVIGILGPWGVGKTSLVNLACEKLDRSEVTVLEFNPWLFSGAEQLISKFFDEIAAELRVGGNKKLSKLGDKLERYGAAVSPGKFVPGVGPLIEFLSSVAVTAGKTISNREEDRSSIHSLRVQLEQELREFDKRFVVVVDDIDRLAPGEVREIFKLVRLTGSFPNVVYVLAFDRIRTQDVLTEEHFDGAAYIEKILQVSYDVPPAPRVALHRLLVEGIDAALSAVETGPLYEASWPDIFAECIWPFIRHARDVRRYLASLPVTLQLLGQEVAVADALALEALRVFEPKTHALLAEVAPALTSLSDGSLYRYNEERARSNAASIDRFVESAGDRSDVVRAICQRLFPATQSHFGGSHYGSEWLGTWKRERSVAHPSILEFYLERVISSEISAAQLAREAFGSMHDSDLFEACLRELDSDELENVLRELVGYEDKFTKEMALPGSRVLLDVLPRLRTESRGMFDFGADVEISRLLLRLLRQLEPRDCADVAAKLMSESHPLSSFYVLVTVVGHRENAGHRLVAQEDAFVLEQQLRALVENSDPNQLVNERQLDRLLWWSQFAEGGARRSPKSLANLGVSVAVLKAARTEVRSQSMGARAVHRDPRLHWNLLLDLFGGESNLRKVIAKVESNQNDPELAEVVNLASRYLAGWKPDDLMRGDEEDD